MQPFPVHPKCYKNFFYVFSSFSMRKKWWNLKDDISQTKKEKKAKFNELILEKT